jgi:hypothetical protein
MKQYEQWKKSFEHRTPFGRNALQATLDGSAAARPCRVGSRSDAWGCNHTARALITGRAKRARSVFGQSSANPAMPAVISTPSGG